MRGLLGDPERVRVPALSQSPPGDAQPSCSPGADQESGWGWGRQFGQSPALPQAP